MSFANLKYLAEYLIRTKAIYPRSDTRRYVLLFELIRKFRIKTILEIGVYDGRRALEMISTARIYYSAAEISYLGFDLFEEMDDEILQSELSKRPHTMDSMKAKLSVTGARIELFRGFSSETLPRLIENRDSYPLPELVFIDGGHAVDTIRSDWENVSKLISDETIVIFDDYYVDRPDLTENFGCNMIIESMGNEYEIDFTERIDTFEREDGILKIRMVTVRKKRDEDPNYKFSLSSQ